MSFLRILADHTIITTNKAMALSQQDNCDQGFIFISLLQPVIHHSKGSERTFDVSFSLQTILVSSQPTKLWHCQQDIVTGFIFISLLQPASHHRKGSEKNFDMSFSLQPAGTALCFKKLLQVQQWPSPISHNSTSNVLNS
jgi:hypothetical protein